jgi:hypothetical protein
VALAWSAVAMVVGLGSIVRHRLSASGLKMAPAVVRD